MKWVAITLVLLLSGCATVAVGSIALGLDDNKWELPIGYYGKYNSARRAIEDTGCLASIDQSYVRKKFVLESFSFLISTKSDWKIGLWFSSDMNVRQVCDHPEGLLIFQPIKKHYQVYSREFLSQELTDRSAKVTNLPDILCNLDLLVPILRANYENEHIPVTAEIADEYTKYLVIDSIPWKRIRTTPSLVKNLGINESRLHTIDFDIVRLDSVGQSRLKETGHAKRYIENVGHGSTLEMIQIPSGTFKMGSPSSDKELIAADTVKYFGHNFGYFWQEYPEHSVVVPTFYMGRFEVTQAQWRAVSKLPKVRMELPSDPSVFKGDDRPVEKISWEEAIEFCERLSLATGRKYRLPTEAEWEYACRAGTSTPFHFGETINPDFANFDGDYPWEAGIWGVKRQETTAVGSFAYANDFGLYDVHGNVEEWCVDVWHSSYDGAPADGSGWMIGGDDRFHVTRGGDWSHMGTCARSAWRGRAATMRRSAECGFRVVASW